MDEAKKNVPAVDEREREKKEQHELEEKLMRVFEAVQGVTYNEWKKISHVIDRNFDAGANRFKLTLTPESPDKLLELFHWLLL